MERIFKGFLVIVALLLVAALAGMADAATLTWDKNPDASYYMVYQKIDGRPDAEYVPVTPQLTTNTFVLPAGEFNITYSYTVKAFNACGNSSDFSDAVKYNRCLTSIVSKVLNVKITIQPASGGQ